MSEIDLKELEEAIHDFKQDKFMDSIYHDDVLAAATAYLESKPQWLPIESAPRDGNFLAVNIEGDIRVIQDSNYDTEYYYSECSIMYPPPTHWQPLPEPPTAANAASEIKKGRS